MTLKPDYEDLLRKNFELENEILKQKEAESNLVKPDELTDGFFITDVTGAVTFCNKALGDPHCLDSLQDLLNGMNFIVCRDYDRNFHGADYTRCPR